MTLAHYSLTKQPAEITFIGDIRSDDLRITHTFRREDGLHIFRSPDLKGLRVTHASLDAALEDLVKVAATVVWLERHHKVVYAKVEPAVAQREQFTLTAHRP